MKENSKRKGDMKSSRELEHTGSTMKRKKLKIDLMCVRKQLDHRKKNSHVSSYLMMSLIICSLVLVKKQTVK